jgi:hypothetical protein
MPATPTYALPYPAGTDLVKDGDNVIQALATQVEALLAQRDQATDWRNVIRNGDMSVCQRSQGVSFTADGYCLDGWIKTHSGGTHTVYRTLAAPGYASTNDGMTHFVQSDVAGQSLAGDYASLTQRIENCRTLAGKTVTLSFTASCLSTAKIGVEVIQSFGTGTGFGTPSADVLTAVGAVTLNAFYTRYSVTFTMPSMASKIRGSNENDYLAVNLWLSAGATYAARASSIGIQNTTIYVSDVQLETGPIANPFQRLPWQQQLAWCQRYYYRMDSTGTQAYPRFASGLVVTTSQSDNMIFFPVTMRASPTFGSSAASTFVNYAGSGVPVGTAIAVNAPTRWGADVTLSSAVYATVGQANHLCGNNLTAAYLEFSAEL